MTQADLALFLATSGHSGVDRIMQNLIPAFAARGLRIDLLKVRGHGPHWDAPPEGARIVDLGAAHVNTAFPALVAYLGKQQPRVLLCDKYKVNRAALLARALARSGTRVAVRLGTTASKDLERRDAWTRRFESLSIRLLYRYADRILTPSRGAAEDLAALAGLPAAAVSVVRSPIVTGRMLDLAAQPAGHPWLEPGQPPVILGVGELCARKDFATLLRAFARIRRRCGCRLIVGGEGRQRDRLLSLARELDIAGDVDLPGFLPNPYAYMARARAFALTSDCEGMPVVLVEAMALGTPVVSTDCPSGPREVLADGRYGPLVGVGDSAALADRLEELLNRPADAALLREASRPYTLADSARQYLEALDLLGGEEVSP
jgi:glycosyltransferase involved in cell wall biosynthesis